MKRVYAMSRTDGAMKIGVSVDPLYRTYPVSINVKQFVKLEYQTDFREDFEKIEALCHKILHRKHYHHEWFWVTTDEAIAAINSAIDISDGNAEDTTKAIKFSPRCNMGLQCPIPDYHPAAWWTLWIPDLPPPKAPQSGNANGRNAPEKMKIERLDKGVPYEVAYDAAMNLSRQDRKRLVIDILKLI